MTTTTPEIRVSLNGSEFSIKFNGIFDYYYQENDRIHLKVVCHNSGLKETDLVKFGNAVHPMKAQLHLGNSCYGQAYSKRTQGPCEVWLQVNQQDWGFSFDVPFSSEPLYILLDRGYHNEGKKKIFDTQQPLMASDCLAIISYEIGNKPFFIS